MALMQLYIILIVMILDANSLIGNDPLSLLADKKCLKVSGRRPFL